MHPDADRVTLALAEDELRAGKKPSRADSLRTLKLVNDALEVAAWRLSSGELPSEQLSDLACTALERGVDSPSLRELARLSRGEVREAMDLFRAALDELGIATPSEDEALWNLTRWTARRIVTGETPPFDGANWIWRVASYRVQEEGDLRVFIGLASEWEDHPALRTAIDAQIVEAAAELLARGTPRRWIKLSAMHAASPLTKWNPNAVLPVEAATLPLSAPLQHDLSMWATDYDEKFDGFDSQADASAFVERGRELVTRLQAELGKSWHVEYMPVPTQAPGLRLRHDQKGP